MLAVTDIEDSHIQSVMHLLEKKAKYLKEKADWEMALMRGPQGDMASLAWKMEKTCILWIIEKITDANDEGVAKADRNRYKPVYPFIYLMSPIGGSFSKPLSP